MKYFCAFILSPLWQGLRCHAALVRFNLDWWANCIWRSCSYGFSDVNVVTVTVIPVLIALVYLMFVSCLLWMLNGMDTTWWFMQGVELGLWNHKWICRMGKATRWLRSFLGLKKEGRQSHHYLPSHRDDNKESRLDVPVSSLLLSNFIVSSLLAVMFWFL